MGTNKVASKNLSLIYQNIEPNLELKLFVSGQLTYLLEKCPNSSSLSAKIVDLENHYLVQLNLVTDRDLLFAHGEDEVIASALDSAVAELTSQLIDWNQKAMDADYDYENF